MTEPRISKIEAGVPIPTARERKVQNPLVAQADRLQVGESFLVEGMAKQKVAAFLFRLRPKKFTTRIVDGGVRIWRTE